MNKSTVWIVAVDVIAQRHRTKKEEIKCAHIFTEYLIITLGSWLPASSSFFCFHFFFSTRPTHIVMTWKVEEKEVQNRKSLQGTHCKMNWIYLFFYLLQKSSMSVCWWCEWSALFSFVLLQFFSQMYVNFAVENVELTRGLSMNNRSKCQISCLNILICTIHTRNTVISNWAIFELSLNANVIFVENKSGDLMKISRVFYLCRSVFVCTRVIKNCRYNIR